MKTLLIPDQRARFALMRIVLLLAGLSAGPALAQWDAPQRLRPLSGLADKRPAFGFPDIRTQIPSHPEDNPYGPATGSTRIGTSTSGITPIPGYVPSAARPPDPLAKLLADAQAATACRAAVDAYLNNRSKENRQKYIDACLSSELPDGYAAVKNAAAGAFTELAGNKVFFCSGTFLSADIFLTTRHCFFHSETGEPNEMWPRLVQGRVKARSSLGEFQLGCRTAGVARAGGVAACDQAAPPFDIADDAIVLSVINGPAGYGGVKAGRPLKQWDDLVLYGQLDTTDRRFRSKVPGCWVRRVAGACVVHGCQADSSSSGAGLFFRDETGEVRIGGMHVAGAATSASCGLASPTPVSVGIQAPGR